MVFLRLLWTYLALVVVLMSGIASVVLVFAYAAPETPAKVVGYWIAAYICIFVAAAILLYQMHARLKRLEGIRWLDEGRRMWAVQQFTKLGDNEKEALKELLLISRMHGNYIRQRFPGVDFTSIVGQTPYLRHEPLPVDVWTIDPDWINPLSELLLYNANLLPGVPHAENVNLAWLNWPLVAWLRQQSLGVRRVVMAMVKAMRQPPSPHEKPSTEPSAEEPPAP